ncbi:MAG TPA: DNA-3-methyladenine glycosylase [bacterium]|nr:DNA-3-methyladenine glycosylase [bacterium]
MVLEPLPRSFYARPVLEVAPDLLGKLLVHVTSAGTASGYITVTEAYMGPEDKAAHSYGGRKTKRTQAMFGPPGHAYIYLIYGLHYCFNVVTAAVGQPQAVLVRALKPKDGLGLMLARRKLNQAHLSYPIHHLSNGPGKLCQALGIDKQQYGWDLTGNKLFIAPGIPVAAEQIDSKPRINIDYADEWAHLPWRFIWNAEC